MWKQEVPTVDMWWRVTQRWVWDTCNNYKNCPRGESWKNDRLVSRFTLKNRHTPPHYLFRRSLSVVVLIYGRDMSYRFFRDLYRKINRAWPSFSLLTRFSSRRYCNVSRETKWKFDNENRWESHIWTWREEDFIITSESCKKIIRNWGLLLTHSESDEAHSDLARTHSDSFRTCWDLSRLVGFHKNSWTHSKLL